MHDDLALMTQSTIALAVDAGTADMAAAARIACGW